MQTKPATDAGARRRNARVGRRPSRRADAAAPRAVETLERRLLFSAAAAQALALHPDDSLGEQIPFTVFAAAGQSDGKIVVVGSSDYGGASPTFGLVYGESQVAVERFNPDGTPDVTFNGGKPLYLSPPDTEDELGANAAGPAEATAVTIDPQGRVLVAGIILDAALYSSTNGQGDLLPAFVFRLSSDGSVDSTFSAPVEAPHDYPYENAAENDTGHFIDIPASIDVTSDGHVVLTGISNFYNTNAALPTHYNAVFFHAYDDSGTPDAAFTGSGENQNGLVAYNAPELVDDLGLKAVYSPQANAIYVGATLATPTYTPFLFKIDAATGAEAPGFNQEAYVSYQPSVATAPGGYADLQTVALQPDGDILLAGVSDPSGIATEQALGLARLTPDGQLDPTFGKSGVFSSSSGFEDLNIRGIQLQPDGQIIVAATTVLDSYAVAFLAALNPNGTLDTSLTTGVAGTGFVQGIFLDSNIVFVGSPTATPAAASATPSAEPSGPDVISANLLEQISIDASQGGSEGIGAIVFGLNISNDSNPQGDVRLIPQVDTGQASIVSIATDNIPPTAAIDAGPGVSVAGGATYSFTVNYADNDYLNAATLGVGSVVVTGPGGYTQLADPTSSTGTPQATSVTYQISAPPGGWSPADNGAYSIVVPAGAVQDAVGNAAASVSAGFEVNAAVAPTPTTTGGAPAPLPQGTLGLVLSAAVPPAVIGGAKAKASALVTLRNPGAQTFSGPVTIALYVGPSESLTGATPVTSLSRRLKLAPGKSRATKIRIASFPAVADGTYYLLATATPSGGSATGGAGPALSIAAPFVKIGVSRFQALGASIAPGKKLAGEIFVTNQGNKPAVGVATLLVSATGSAAGASIQPIGSTPLRVSLKPGQAKLYKFKLATSAGLAAGTDTLSAALNVSAVGDPSPADGIIASATPLQVT